MNLPQFTQQLVKESSWIPPVRASNFIMKLIRSGVLKASLLAGGGAAAGAAATHAAGKKREKKVAKQFYWLGRNTGK